MNRAYYRVLRSAAGMFKTSATIKTLSLTGRIPFSDSIEILKSTSALPKEERKAAKVLMFQTKYTEQINKLEDQRLKLFCETHVTKNNPPSSFTCRVLSGHGPSRNYLHRFGKIRAPNCDCGESTQSLDHLSRCNMFPSNLEPYENLNSFDEIENWCKLIHERARTFQN